MKIKARTICGLLCGSISGYACSKGFEKLTKHESNLLSYSTGYTVLNIGAVLIFGAMGALLANDGYADQVTSDVTQTESLKEKS